MTQIAVQQRDFFHWTLEQYHQLAEANILQEEDQTELLNGQIVYISPIGKLHAAAVRRIDKLLQKILGDDALISTQNPISLPINDSEPQPDLVVLKPRADFYASQHPGPEDIYLLIEIADSTLDKDRSQKIPLYAQAGVIECWLVNLSEQNIEVYTAPSPKGYNNIRIHRQGDSIESDFLGKIKVERVLG
jgi:Uma2 family endonuclease